MATTEPTFLLTKEMIEKKLLELNGSYRTDDIKRAFAALFMDPKYSVYSNLSDYDDAKDLLKENKEFLYDLIVVEEEIRKEDRIQPFVTDTVLVLESERECKFNYVMFDFQKLLVANSKYKVMLFRCHSSELKSYIDYMSENIDRYRLSEGTFFMVSFLNDKGLYEVSEKTATRTS